jgi:hypothetical protein
MTELTQAKLGEVFIGLFDRLALEHGLTSDGVIRVLRTLFFEVAIFDDESGNDWFKKLEDAGWSQACEDLDAADKVLGVIFLLQLQNNALLRARIAALGHAQVDADRFRDARLEAATATIESALEGVYLNWFGQRLPFSNAQALKIFSLWTPVEDTESWSIQINAIAFLEEWTQFIRADPGAYRPHLLRLREQFSENPSFSEAFKLEGIETVDFLLTDPKMTMQVER